MGFREAKELLGLRDAWASRPAGVTTTRQRPPAWTPDPAVIPPELWRTKGVAVVTHCEAELAKQTTVLQWLCARGISNEAARKYRLGFHVVAKGGAAYRPLSAWGLNGPRKPDGRESCLALLPGLVIPYFNADGELNKLKVREFEGVSWPEWAAGDKYREIKGSNQRYSVYGQGRDVVVVVETELDAMLLAERVGDIAACVSTGSAQRRPDATATELLRAARLVLNALDADAAGAKAAWSWWAQEFPNARRWPVPKNLGKDPGDLARAGVDVRLWVMAGVRRHAPALLAAATPVTDRSKDAPYAPASVAPARQRPSSSWPVPDGALSELMLPEGAPLIDDLVRAMRLKPIDAPDSLTPCPRTRPRFWWVYQSDCADCAGHPHCLQELFRSRQFQEALM
jgi:DNA primase